MPMIWLLGPLSSGVNFCPRVIAIIVPVKDVSMKLIYLLQFYFEPSTF